ncbi:MAG: YggT family protein [Nitrospirae bacterium]|nr:YggT family protein [Nitrospirota bacterium]
MFVMSNLIMAVAKVMDILLTLFMWLIIIRALLSWVNPDPYNPIVQILYRVTDPILTPLRRVVPTWRMGIDISPILAVLIIVFLQMFLVNSLQEWAMRVR